MSIVDITVDTTTSVAYIRLNRPEKRNALNAEMRHLLFTAMEELGGRQDVSTIHLSGAGPTFCAGHDQTESRAKEPPTAVVTWRGIREELKGLRALREVSVPLVIAIQGHCYGMATLMASLADIVVVADDATIGTPRAGGGAGYHGPVMEFVTQGRKAREIELRYGQMSGKEAAEIGWANYAVPASELETFTRELAEDVARQPRDLLEVRKASMNLAQDLQGFSLAVEMTAVWDALGHGSDYSLQLSKDIASKGLQSMISEVDRRMGRSPAAR